MASARDIFTAFLKAPSAEEAGRVFAESFVRNPDPRLGEFFGLLVTAFSGIGIDEQILLGKLEHPQQREFGETAFLTKATGINKDVCTAFGVALEAPITERNPELGEKIYKVITDLMRGKKAYELLSSGVATSATGTGKNLGSPRSKGESKVVKE